LKHIIAAFARNPVLANMLMIAVLVGGAVCAVRMKTEVFPEFSLNLVTVTIVYPGAGPAEIEEGISIKVEEAIQGIPGVKRVTSTSSEGISAVVAELKADVKDPRKVQYDVRDAVERVDTFPDDAERPITTELVMRRQAINVAVFGDAPEGTLKEIGRSVKDDLLSMPNISQVEWSGVRDYEIHVEVSESALREYGLTFSDVAAAVRAGSINLPGGTIRGTREDIKLNTEGRKYLASEYADIVVLARPDGTRVRLSQVAKIIDGFEENPRYAHFNGKRSVTVAVFKTSDEDAIDIARTVRDYCRKRSAALPAGVSVEPWMDTSTFINSRLSLLLRNARIGMVLVFLCLWLFLNGRLSFWVALGIPVSFAGGLIFMMLMGQTINMISLFALIMVMGIVVDDAIIVGENVHAFVRRGVPAARAIVEATLQVNLPVIASVSTTICAFAPLLFVEGIMGKFIRVLPLVVIATLAASLAECFLILPAHLRNVRALGDTPARRGFLEWPRSVRKRIDACVDFLIRKLYRSAFKRALRNRYVTISLALFALLVSAGLFAGGQVRYTPLPEEDSDFLSGTVTFPAGTPLEVTERALVRIEDAMEEINEDFAGEARGRLVRQVATSFGESILGGFSAGGNVGEVLVQLAPAEERKIDSRKLVAEWRKRVGPIPEVISVVFEGAHGGPGGKPIEIQLRADDLDTLRRAAADLKGKLAQYAGTGDITDDFRPGKREFRVTLKPQGRVLGITVLDLARQLRQGFFGDEVLRIQRGRDDVKVRVRYPQEERRRLSDVEKVRIRAPAGGEVPFHEVALVSLEREPANIRRQDGKRVITVSSDVDQTVANADEIVADLGSGYLRDLQARHAGLAVSLEGQKKETAEALGALKITFPMALLAIFSILAIQFRSYAKPLVIMMSIPFGMVGAVLGHFVMGRDLTLMSVFGLVAVSGVVVNDALVLIDFVNRNIREGMTVFDAVKEAGPARFRAIALTSLTTIAGLAPLVLEKSFQAQFLIPMAVSISWGLAAATLVNLFVTPSIYLALNDVRRVIYVLFTGRWPTAEEMDPEVRAARRTVKETPQK